MRITKGTFIFENFEKKCKFFIFRKRVLAIFGHTVFVKTVLSPEFSDKRLHMHEITAEEINTPNHRDVDLTHATSLSEVADASSKHERANIGLGNVISLHDLCSTLNATALPIEFDSSHLNLTGIRP